MKSIFGATVQEEHVKAYGGECAFLSMMLAQRRAGAVLGPMAAAPDVRCLLLLKDCSTRLKEVDEESCAAGPEGGAGI